MRNLLATIRLIVLSIGRGVGWTTSHLTYPSRFYLHGLGMFATLAILAPLPLAIPGVWFGKAGLTATAGLLWALALVVLGIWGAPIGALLNALWKAELPPRINPPQFFLWRWMDWWIMLPLRAFRALRDGAARYIGFVKGIIIAELVLMFLLSIVPVRHNITALPLLFLAALIIWLSTDWHMGGKWRRLIRMAANVTIFAILFSFFMPQSFASLSKKLKLIDPLVSREIETNGSSITKWLASYDKTDTNGLVIYRVPVGETNIIFPDSVQAVVIPVTDTQFSGWINIPWNWNSTWHWTPSDPSARVGIFIQGLTEEKPDYVPPLETRALKWFNYRVKAEKGGGEFIIRRRS